MDSEPKAGWAEPALGRGELPPPRVPQDPTEGLSSVRHRFRAVGKQGSIAVLERCWLNLKRGPEPAPLMKPLLWQDRDQALHYSRIHYVSTGLTNPRLRRSRRDLLGSSSGSRVRQASAPSQARKGRRAPGVSDRAYCGRS